MKITKASAAKVLSELSPLAVKIIRSMFVDKQGIEIKQAELAEYHNAIIELIARNVVRADYDIIHGRFVTVLQPGGKRIANLLAGAQ